MSVDYEYDFTNGLYRAKIKTTYKRSDMSMSDFVYSNKYIFRKYDYYIFKTNNKIIVDPNTLTAPNARLIKDAIDQNYWGFSYRKYDNGLYIVYDAPDDKCGFSTYNYPDVKYLYYDPNVVFRPLRMEYNFGNDYSGRIQEIAFGTRLDLSNTVQLQTMFKGGTGLKYVNLDNLRFSSKNDVYEMFQSCNSIENIDLSKCFTSFGSCEDLFSNCNNLKYLNLNNITFRSGWTMRMFTNCNSLKEIKSPLKFNYPNYAPELPFTMYDAQGRSYTKLPDNNITIYATNPIS